MVAESTPPASDAGVELLHRTRTRRNIGSERWNI